MVGGWSPSRSGRFISREGVRVRVTRKVVFFFLRNAKWRHEMVGGKAPRILNPHVTWKVGDHIHVPAVLYPGKEFVLQVQGKLSLFLRNAKWRLEIVGGKAPRILDLEVVSFWLLLPVRVGTSLMYAEYKTRFALGPVYGSYFEQNPVHPTLDHQLHERHAI